MGRGFGSLPPQNHWCDGLIPDFLYRHVRKGAASAVQKVPTNAGPHECVDFMLLSSEHSIAVQHFASR